MCNASGTVKRHSLATLVYSLLDTLRENNTIRSLTLLTPQLHKAYSTHSSLVRPKPRHTSTRYAGSFPSLHPCVVTMGLARSVACLRSSRAPRGELRDSARLAEGIGTSRMRAGPGGLQVPRAATFVQSFCPSGESVSPSSCGLGRHSTVGN